MVATTKTESRRAAGGAAKPRAGETAEAHPEADPLPDVAAWVRHTFFAGDGPAVPPGVAMMRANPLASGADRMLDGIVQMQAEMARFGARRVHCALEAQAKMLACRSASELHAARRAYVDGLAEDYAHEWSRLVGYGMRVGMGQSVPPPPDPGDERHATPV